MCPAASAIPSWTHQLEPCHVPLSHGMLQRVLAAVPGFRASAVQSLTSSRWPGCAWEGLPTSPCSSYYTWLLGPQAGFLCAGNDLNEDISPVQAGLKWTIGKRRQQSCDFLGGEVGWLSLLSGLDVPGLRKCAVTPH